MLTTNRESANRKQDDDINDQDDPFVKKASMNDENYDDPFVMMLQNDQVASMLSVSFQQFSMLLS